MSLKDQIISQKFLQMCLKSHVKQLYRNFFKSKGRKSPLDLGWFCPLIMILTSWTFKQFSSMPYELPSLPYSPNALEPHFDARGNIMANIIKLMWINWMRRWEIILSYPIFDLSTDRDLSKVPEEIRGAVRNNGRSCQPFLFLGILSPNNSTFLMIL